MTKPIFRAKGKYLGGLPDDPKPWGTGGDAMFYIKDRGIGCGQFNRAQHGVVYWEMMQGIEFSGGVATKSKVGATVMFGVAGALGSAGSQDRTEMTVHLKDGSKAYYQILGHSELAVRAQLLPVMSAHGVPCLNDATA